MTHNSRAARPGALFVAVTGRREDGHRQRPRPRRAERSPSSPNVSPILRSPPASRSSSSPRAGGAERAGRGWYQRPSVGVVTVAGVTGTDGKTTTATMLWAAWRAAGLRGGLISTVDFRDGDVVTANTTRVTTLEAVDTQRRLAELRDSGCTHVVLETSSHGLEMHRVDDVDYRLAVYTRITSEHLDVHGDREGYFAAKARLLQMVGSRPDGVAVLDRDDDFAYPRLAAMPVATRLTYSASGMDADLVAESVSADANGVRLTARTPWGTADLSLKLAGRFNAANALAAIAASCSSGASFDAAVAGIAGLERVNGRMERVDAGQPFMVVIDYAHTADSLEKVLTELRAAGEWAPVGGLRVGGGARRGEASRHGGGGGPPRRHGGGHRRGPTRRGPRRHLRAGRRGRGECRRAAGREPVRHPRPHRGDRLRARAGRAGRHGAVRRQGPRELDRHRGGQRPVGRASRRRGASQVAVALLMPVASR